MTKHIKIDLPKVMLSLLIILVVGGLIGGIYLAGKNYIELRSYKEDRDVQLLKERLSRHFILPEEEPLVATVTDVEKLKQEQAFYRNAQNGDKVFIWNDKALIYRNAEDKIVDFGIIVSQDQGGLNDLEQETDTRTVKILNGSGVANAANDVAAALRSNPQLGNSGSLYEMANASSDQYAQTVVVDVSGANGELANQIASTIDGTVLSQVPDAEAQNVSPTDDIIIVVGGDIAQEESAAPDDANQE